MWIQLVVANTAKGAMNIGQAPTQTAIPTVEDDQSQAANCRRDLNCLASATVATIALAVIGPMPGIVDKRRLIPSRGDPNSSALSQSPMTARPSY